MATEYFVDLNGHKRPARFTRQERIDIEKRFDCDVFTFVYEKCLPTKDGKFVGGGRLECQEALIYFALRHNGPKVTEGYVSQELQKLTAKGGNIYEPISEAVVALVRSGVMGFTPPVEEEEPEGKDEAAAEPATS